MKTYQEIYREFLKDYITKHSPFRVNDTVVIRGFQSNQEFIVSTIEVDSDGEFYYKVTSPRSFSTIPRLFRHDAIEKVQ